MLSLHVLDVNIDQHYNDFGAHHGPSSNAYSSFSVPESPPSFCSPSLDSPCSSTRRASIASQIDSLGFGPGSSSLLSFGAAASEDDSNTCMSRMHVDLQLYGLYPDEDGTLLEENSMVISKEEALGLSMKPTSVESKVGPGSWGSTDDNISFRAFNQREQSASFLTPRKQMTNRVSRNSVLDSSPVGLMDLGSTYRNPPHETVFPPQTRNHAVVVTPPASISDGLYSPFKDNDTWMDDDMDEWTIHSSFDRNPNDMLYSRSRDSLRIIRAEDQTWSSGFLEIKDDDTTYHRYDCPGQARSHPKPRRSKGPVKRQQSSLPAEIEVDGMLCTRTQPPKYTCRDLVSGGQICGRKFQRSEHLNRHRKTEMHDPKFKPFVCELPKCNKGFNRRDNYKQHIIKTHLIQTERGRRERVADEQAELFGWAEYFPARDKELEKIANEGKRRAGLSDLVTRLPSRGAREYPARRGRKSANRDTRRSSEL